MAARVTDSEVQAVVMTTVDTTSFIATATLIVDEDLANLGHSAARLKQIELYLAAHFTIMSTEKGGLESVKLGDATDRYKAQSGLGLNSTRFGQQAIALETTGTLAGLAESRLKAAFRVV